MASEAVAATVSDGRRLRLPKAVFEALKIEDGQQVMFYIDREKGVVVLVHAKKAFKSMKELWGETK